MRIDDNLPYNGWRQFPRSVGGGGKYSIVASVMTAHQSSRAIVERPGAVAVLGNKPAEASG